MKTKKDPRNRIRRLIKNWAVPVGCGLLFLFLLKFVFFVGYVPTASMEPAIKEGSIIIGVRIYGELERGDVIVFEHEGRLLVKRIAGLPGDIVYIDEDPANKSVSAELPGAALMLTVPDDCYFVLGDNTDASTDSRCWEEPFITLERILAIVLTAD